jgi:hypothetical protein
MQRGSARCLLRLKRHHAGRANTRQVRAAGREERKMGYGSLPVVARRIRVLVPQFPFPLGPCPTLGVFAEETSPLLPFLLRPVPTYALFLVPPRPFATPSSGLAHKEWQTLATPRDPSRPARPERAPMQHRGPLKIDPRVATAAKLRDRTATRKAFTLLSCAGRGGAGVAEPCGECFI